MTDPSSPSCRVTLLTAPGRGAIATISVCGDRATSLVDTFFRPARRRALGDVSCGRIVFGYWSPGGGEGEEVVVCRKSHREFEIHCHGGHAAPEAILANLRAAGAVSGEPADWAKQHLRDPLSRAARLALRRALTTRAASVLLDQYRGALRDTLQQTLELVAGQRITEAMNRLQRLLQWSDLGQRLQRPWRVVFGGRPNVGKSSLINAMLGYPRAIVMDAPGTTRDILTAVTALDGWPVELIDTAGLQSSEDAIEIEGVARAQQQLNEADLVICVEDGKAFPDEQAEPWTSRSPRQLVVHNKCDLLDGATIARIAGLTTSALTGAGIELLMTRIVRELVATPPGPGEAVPFEASQVDAIRRAQLALGQNDYGRLHSCITGLLVE
ncbi:MAG: GTPase [Pirellulaceae bacterium]